MRIPFSSDKARHNKFNFKLKLCGKDMVDQWKVIRAVETTSPGKFDAFVNDVIAKDFKEERSRKRTITEPDQDMTAAGWIAF